MSFITQNDFSRVINHPVSMPQAEIRAGETVVISSAILDENAKIDVSALCLNVVRVSSTTRSSRLCGCSQSGNVVTAFQDFFEESDVGSTIRWDTGEEDFIAKFISPTVVYTVKNQTVSYGYFELTGGPPKLINTGFGTIYVGIYAEKFSGINRPTGTPIFSLTLDSPGLVSLPLRSRRIFHGPDVVSVAITNNTSNLDKVEAVVSGCLKSYV